jgi:urease accessory protein
MQGRLRAAFFMGMPYDSRMTAAIPREAVATLSPVLADRRWNATLDLGFASRAGRTTLAHCRHDGPLLVQQPLYPEGPQTCHVIVVHPPGGIAGGDQLALSADIGEGAHAMLTTPGAGKFYKSPLAAGSLKVCLSVAAGGVVEWLPQETIVFDAADARMALDIRMAQGACAIAQDIVVLGRTASAERFAAGRLRQTLTLSIEDEPVIDERSDVRAGSAWLAAAPGWQGCAVAGTFVAARASAPAAYSADATFIEKARAVLTPFAHRAALTQLTSDIIIGRYLGNSAEEARAAFAALWAVLRPTFANAPAHRPRIWAT